MANLSRKLLNPLSIRRTGDDSPAVSIWRYVWRMTGMHQICVCLLALVVAGRWRWRR